MNRILFFLTLFIITGVAVPSLAQVGRVGINTSTPLALFHVQDSSVIFKGPQVPGPPGLTPVTGTGWRMMWYADKAAFRVGSVVGSNWDRDSIGNFSFGAGSNVKAMGSQSAALNSQTLASGSMSTAIGRTSKASGQTSFSGGRETLASGIQSMAFGRGTIASGLNAFAFGHQTQASGENSMAFGSLTVATLANSVALGESTHANAMSSLALGSFTESFGQNSIAGGYLSVTNGPNSLAMGISVEASGENSVAFGNLTTASHASSFAVGDRTVAGNTNATSMGFMSSALGITSHAFGTQNITYGDNAMVGGYFNIATGDQSLSIGKMNNSLADQSVVFGEQNFANSYSSFVIGRYNDTTGVSSRTQWVANDPLFIIAGGDPALRRNVFTVLKDGRTGIKTTTPDAVLDVFGTVKLGSDGSVLTSIKKDTIQIDLPSIPAGTAHTELIGGMGGTFPGGVAYLSPAVSLPDGLIISYVRLSSNIVTEVKFFNASAAAIDLPLTTFYGTVIN